MHSDGKDETSEGISFLSIMQIKLIFFRFAGRCFFTGGVTSFLAAMDTAETGDAGGTGLSITGCFVGRTADAAFLRWFIFLFAHGSGQRSP